MRDWLWDRKRSISIWVLGGLLVEAGLGGLLEGGLFILPGILWLVSGLLIIPRTRSLVLDAVEAAGGPAADSIGRGVLLTVVVTGILAGGVIAPELPDESSSASVDTETPNELVFQTGTATSTESPIADTRTLTPTANPTRTLETSSSTNISDQSPTPTEPSTERETEWTVTVLDVVDGDTMDVRMPDGSRETIRLLGVDSPETTDGDTSPAEWEGIPDSQAGRSWLVDWGAHATTYAEDRLAGREVHIEVDQSADRRGSFGRLLVYVYQTESASTSFNRRLIENGYARLYESDFSQLEAFSNAESSVRSSQTGVWGYEGSTVTPTPTATDEPSRSGPDTIEIVRIHEDARGDEYENLDDEYVVLENVGDQPVDLGGWTLSDDDGHTFTFYLGYTLESGDQVTIYTGDGTNTESEIYWGQDAPVWNNAGDTVILQTSNGEVIEERSYV